MAGIGLLPLFGLCVALGFAAQAAVQQHAPMLGREANQALLLAAKENPWEHFTHWIERHAKSYVSDAEELALRYATW
jgi:predicted methyltransferase